jgi:hypothetical protein
MKKRLSVYIKTVMLEDRNPVGTIINDKIRVKEYCEGRLSRSLVDELFSHRIYAGYNAIECMASIERPCVVRLNNGWHKMKFLLSVDDEIKIETLKEWQSTKWTSCEWSYKQIKPGFTVERILPLTHYLYKLFIFHGKVKYIWVQKYNIESRKIDLLGATMYDRNWNKTNAQWNNAPMPDCKKPTRLIDMLDIAEKLYCSDWKFMRVDMYCFDNRIRFSEMMQYHAGGTNGFGDFDYVLGGEI